MQPDKYLSDNDPETTSELASLLRSPPLPSSPAPPAYSALPFRETDFHLAPLLNARVGEIELETIDGKRFLVHRKILEQETVFFHIYYGFVPVWRLNSANPTLPPQSQFTSHQAPPTGTAGTGATTLNNLLCLPKLLASHLRSSSCPSIDQGPDRPPAPPPKDSNSPVTAPTPTSNPYTWAVPETSPVLLAFLSLIYPKGTFTAAPETPLSSLELTSRVVRAALGYQSSKALGLARDRLYGFIHAQPVEVYSMASFFRFADLARLASQKAMSIPSSSWGNDSRVLMGKSALSRLEELQNTRLAGLREILARPMEADQHSAGCVRRGMVEDVWTRKVREVVASLTPESELLELLNIDLRGGHCGDCLVQLGTTIQRCLYAAKELPQSV